MLKVKRSRLPAEMPDVFDTVYGPGSTPLVGTKVKVCLSVAGYDTGSQQTVLGCSTVRTDENGYWEMDLRPNSGSGITDPPNTYYEVKVAIVNGKTETYSIQVPDGAGPYWAKDILI